MTEFAIPSHYLEAFKDFAKRLHGLNFEKSSFKKEIGRTMYKGHYLCTLSYEDEDKERIEFSSYAKKRFEDMEAEFYAYLNELEKEQKDG